MKSNWQILANITGIPKRVLLDQREEKLIRPSEAVDAMGVVIELTKEECKKKKK